MQQSSTTPSLHLDFLGVAEDCCMLSILLAVPSCTYSFWHGVIPTSYFIFNDFYTCIIMEDICTGSSGQVRIQGESLGSEHPPHHFYLHAAQDPQALYSKKPHA